MSESRESNPLEGLSLSRRKFLRRSAGAGAGLFVLGGGLAAFLEACQGAASSASQASTSATSLASATASASAAVASSGPPIKLSSWRYASFDQEVKPWEAVLAQWNTENPGIQVELQTFPIDAYLDTTLTSAFAAGIGPDLFIVSPGQSLNLVNAGVAAPLDDIMADVKAGFRPNALAAVTVDGHVISLPYEMEPVALYYRTDLLEKAGVQPPTTWDELLAAAEKLTTKDRSGILIETGPGAYEAFTWYPFLWQGGGDVVNADWTQSQMSSDAAVAALDLWGTLVGKGYAPKQSKTPSYDIGALARGETAMQISGVWSLADIKAFPGTPFNVVPLPIPSGGQPVSISGGFYQMVNAKSPNVEAAKKFVRWLWIDNKEWAKSWSCGFAAPYPEGAHTELAPQLAVTQACGDQGPMIATMNDIASTARPEPRFPQGILNPVSDAIQAVMFGGKTGQQAAADADTAINAFLASYKGAHN